VTLTPGRVIATVSFGVLSPERLASRGWARSSPARSPSSSAR
jgi:hypothetical protein